MKLATLKALVILIVACIWRPAFAEVTCSFDVRSTINGNEGLSGHGFRVRESDAGLQLEQRYADGSWNKLGAMERFIRSGFTVFLHLPTEGRRAGRVRVLTVHESGNASLMIHHGSVGGGSQYKRAWLYQGACE